MRDGPVTFVTFEPAGAPPRRMIVSVPGGATDVFEAVEDPRRPTSRDLQEYAGVYYCPELRVAHILAVRHGELTVGSTGRGRASLRPIIRDHFNQGYPWWLGYDIHFQRGPEQEVLGFRVSNYHAKNVRFDKLGR